MSKIYTKEKLEEAVKVCYSYAEVIRYVGGAASGASYKRLKKLIDRYNLDTTHFTFIQKRNPDKNFSNITSLLVIYNPPEPPPRNNTLLKHLVKNNLKKYICEKCGVGCTYNSLPLTLQLHHKNGESLDFRIENLEVLCPNCHSQTHNWGSKNVKSRKIKKYTCIDCGEVCNRSSLRCKECAPIAARVVERPSKETLKELVQTKAMTTIGKMFGVTDNTVRKWVRYYDIGDFVNNRRRQ